MKIWDGALRVGAGWLAAVFVGYLGFGGRVFDPELTYFQFVVFGLVGSFFVVVWPLVQPRWIAVLGGLAFVVVAFSAGSQTPPRLIRDAVWVVAIIGAVKLDLQTDRLLPAVKVGKFVVWAAIFAGTQALAVMLLVLLKSHALTVNPALPLTAAHIGALLGFALGLTHELTLLVATRRRRS